MKVGNSGLQNLNLTKTIEEQLNKLPETIASAPDLNVVANQGQGQADQAAKSESAKLSGAAQETLIRAELELKYTKPNNGSETSESTGERRLNESQRKAAEEALGDPMERLQPDENNSNDPHSDKGNSDVANRMKEFGSVYGDGTPSSTSGSGGASSFSDSSRGGGESSVSSGERMTPEQRAKFAEMAGFNQGPESATSKMEDVNSRVPEGGTGRRDAAVRGIIDSANPFIRVNDPGSSHQGGKYGGKEMISQGNYSDLNVEGVTHPASAVPVTKNGEVVGIVKGDSNKAKDFLSSIPVVGDDLVKGTESAKNGSASYTDRVNDAADSDPTIPKSDSKESPGGQGTTGETHVVTKDDGTKIVMRPDGSRTELKTNGDWADYDANGKKTDSGSVQDTEQDEASRGKAARQKLGFDLVNLPKAPKTSGDVDPTEDGSELNYGGQLNSAISQQGKDGLIGQPADRVTEGGSPSGNLSMGGDVDFENKSGWSGREITEEPGDINLPGQQEDLPPASNQQEEEESHQKTKSALSAQLALNLYRANQIRMKG